MANELRTFAAELARTEPTELQAAIALIWFLTTTQASEEVTVADLASTMHSLGLTGSINRYRLDKKLSEARAYVSRGSAKGAFRIKLSKNPELQERYGSLLNKPIVKVDGLVLPSELFKDVRKYLHSLVWEINGTYQYGFYDGCAVLCRRLIELLLILAFEKASQSSAIKIGSDYMMLDGIIAKAKSGQYIRLARNTGGLLDAVKRLGDAGAHHRTHITDKQDIDDIKGDLRRAVSDLVHLAGLDAKPAESAK